ncbi:MULTISPECIES: hypothetical protein [Pseudomonas]|uniref:hypothetical protein n=1 Tax=Pseudomonas TaxID=286 RepID=UPI00059D32D6|nr:MULTISPECIES: hypothetical protein [Pseudomonas]AMT87876.1 hypothetical protein AYO71_10085 [Pseudomonas koreensis]MBB4058436.1 hypothetical protein [Pseudomonas koreensis]TSB50717.1 hypothetical protein FEE99_17840 [Pseudomonas sp. ef1]
MDDRSYCEIRLDVQVNYAELLTEAQNMLEKNPIESILVRFSHRHAFDFGAFCFGERSGSRARRKVKLSTRLPKRLARIKNLASHIISMSLTKTALSSAYSAIADWVIMAKWCEANGLENFLNTPELYHDALVAFTQHLNGDHREYDTRRRMQTVCKTCGEQMFPEENYLFTKLPLIVRPHNKATKEIEPPSLESVKYLLQTYEPLFIGLTDFLTKEEQIPYKLKIKDDYAWIVADDKYTLITSKILGKGGARTAGSLSFDYSKACMRTFEEYKARRSGNYDNYYFQAKKSYESRLELANSSKNNKYRASLARFAHDCFVAMFVAATAINESPLRELPWDAKYIVTQDEEIGMRSIKFRANNKEISVRVKADFIKHFKKYVQLRDYLCMGNDHPYLFVGFDGNSMSNYRILDTNILRRLYDRVCRFIDPTVPCLSYQSFRNYKDSYVAKNHGHEASRILLGHSERTQRSNYLKAGEKNAVDQIGKFHAAVNEFFGSPHPCLTPVGGCSSEGAPQKINIAQITTEPDCKSEVGCLNCAHHKVHANRDDAWKLISLEFVTKQMIQSSASLTHFELIHGPTLKKIDQLLHEMLVVNPSLGQTLKDLREDVYLNNTLTDYWERHLERLIRLKVIV